MSFKVKCFLFKGRVCRIFVNINVTLAICVSRSNNDFIGNICNYDLFTITTKKFF